ncbi:hypothetical protein BJX64DRAFT_286146 [Aspergillus heterothallicus]
MGGFFSLAGTASITDVFAVHERGRRIGLWNFAVVVSVNLTPVISGYVITALSWRWAFWLEAILFNDLTVVILCFPETTLHHGSISNTSGSVHEGIPENLALKRRPALLQSSAQLRQ